MTATDELAHIITPFVMERAGWRSINYAGRVFWRYRETGIFHNWGSAVEQEKRYRVARGVVR